MWLVIPRTVCSTTYIGKIGRNWGGSIDSQVDKRMWRGFYHGHFRYVTSQKDNSTMLEYVQSINQDWSHRHLGQVILLSTGIVGTARHLL